MGATEETIARFIVETAETDIPSEALRSARLGSFDCTGTMLAGAASPPGKIMAKFIREAGGTPEATVVGTGLRTSPVLAALANGTMAHVLDYDDFGPMGHPSCVLLPPLVSLGERMGASGKDILNAYVIGLEVGHSISSGCRYTQWERGFHVTSMYGAMAATAACARLLKLNVEQTIMALGLAGSTVGGIVQNFGTYTKGLHAGLAAQSGVMACLLAGEGWKATENIFEGKAGFLHAYVGKDMYSPETIRGTLGKWRASNDITIKKYPCCARNHNALDSVIFLMKEHHIRFEDIERVDVEGLPHSSSALLYSDPVHGFQGKFSIHYNLATAIIDKHIDIDSYTDEKVKRPELRQALNKVKVHVMPLWDPGYGGHAAENPVTITLKDGRIIRKSTNLFTMRGSPADPLTEDELFVKFKFCAAQSLPQSEVDHACDVWWNLQKLGDIREGLEAVAGTSVAKA